MNSNQIKKILVGTSITDENYDACVDCRTEKHISELNLVTGKCSVCDKNKIRITKEIMEKLLNLDRGFK